MTQPPIRILCVDDHSFLVAGLRAKIEAELDLEFVGSLGSATTLVQEVAAKRPNVVLLDIEMPGPDPF
ncbi:MAG: response regulator, partial [Planctomycetota bacterium]